MVEEIRELYAYNGWANRRMLDSVAALAPEALHRDLGSSFPSAFETLRHMLFAEWIWLERWRGRSPTGPAAELEVQDTKSVRGRWEEVMEAQRAFVEALRAEDLGEILRYRNTAGEPHAAPLVQILRHVVNHSTYHRGQVATLLRQLGSQPAATDLVLFYRERSAASADRP